MKSISTANYAELYAMAGFSLLKHYKCDPGYVLVYKDPQRLLRNERSLALHVFPISNSEQSATDRLSTFPPELIMSVVGISVII